ncbi:hypothetical protein EYF80_058144 [Liparis tanakae]|uniref:Uncharacterized protein n=1 Tax=Liparis tanakae TaxID=230148 RepID=A0A4Z2ES00_9TELE|nr:hypothetical protein EYF80_058144 [Liparis tanakae]
MKRPHGARSAAHEVKEVPTADAQHSVVHVHPEEQRSSPLAVALGVPDWRASCNSLSTGLMKTRAAVDRAASCRSARFLFTAQSPQQREARGSVAPEQTHRVNSAPLWWDVRRQPNVFCYLLVESETVRNVEAPSSHDRRTGRSLWWNAAVREEPHASASGLHAALESHL